MDTTTLAIILGCTLGGTAVIVALIIITICCCCCRIPKTTTRKEQSVIVDDSGNNAYSNKKPGMPPYYPPVIGSGSQQWKKNPSMTTHTPAVIAVDPDRTSGLPSAGQAVDVSPQSQYMANQPYDRAGWYQRTVGRAKQFFNSNNSVLDANRESEQPIVQVFENRSHMAQQTYAANVNRLTQMAEPGNRKSDSNGSQTTLIHQDYNSSSLDSNGGLVNAFAASRAAVKSNTHQLAPGSEDTRLVSVSNDAYNPRYSSESTIVPMFPQASSSPPIASDIYRPESTVSKESAYVRSESRLKRYDLSSELESVDSWGNVQVTDSNITNEPVAERALNRQRPTSIMPPTRLASEVRDSDNESERGNDAQMDIQADTESPRKSRTISVFSEEKNTINEAFQFLEELDE